jgi:hypothetical protein
MKKLLLSLLLAASPVFASSPDVQIYTARAEGSLTIGADGRVLDVELTSEASLGTGVLEGYEQRVRSWRFEPIVEDGQPVNAKGLMRLSLVARREKGDDMATFAIRGVQFLDPPGKATEWPRLAQPSYPSNALKAGAGAEVMLLLKLDAQGRVQSAATEQLALLGVATRQAHQANLAAQFRRSAEKIAMEWTIGGQPDGQVVRVPVRYTTDRWARGWAPTAMQPVELPEWAVLELTAKQATELSAGGVATAGQFKLLTPLDGA